MVDDPLVCEPVYAHLDWQWSWRGLTLMHLGGAVVLPVFLWPILWFLQETVFPDVSLLIVFPILAASAAFVVLAQYRQPTDAFFRTLARMSEPSTLSPSRDPMKVSRPFSESWFS